MLTAFSLSIFYGSVLTNHQYLRQFILLNFILIFVHAQNLPESIYSNILLSSSTFSSCVS